MSVVRSKLGEENADLRLDKDRLLGVLRKHRDAGRAESVAAHKERIRKRNMSEKEVRDVGQTMILKSVVCSFQFDVPVGPADGCYVSTGKT